MTSPFLALDWAVYWIVRSALPVAVRPSGCLVSVEGYYGVADDARSCHPLEAALVAEPVAADWRAAAATVLGVGPEWVVGFEDGFALAAPARNADEYARGHLTGRVLRAGTSERLIEPDHT
ncbi:hypothetical protein J0H58_14815 [bacterium]|nr:hypothetical protein [bacterium]